MGNSWGTMLAVQRHPELFSAYIGSGQMVNPREPDQISDHDTLAWAQRTGDIALVNTLTTSDAAGQQRIDGVRAEVAIPVGS